MNRNRLNKFLQFCNNHKIPKMLKKLSSEELIDLYERYSPVVYHRVTVSENTAVGMLLIPKILEELKKRHKTNRILMNLDYTKEVNLREVIRHN